VLSVQKLEFDGAAARIDSADIAMEVARSARFEILQQTATAILAQANQAPQIALTLLQASAA
jgi:flagellin